jgi:hypothetical protein
MSLDSRMLCLAVVLLVTSIARSADLTPEAAAALLVKADPHPAIPLDEQARLVLDRASREPAFRAGIIRILAEHLGSYAEPYKGDREVVALRRLKAVEAIPALKQRWEKTPKQVFYLPWADPRVQLVETLALLLSPEARVEFLITAMDDDTEAPVVRLFAEVAAAADGDKALVEHVIQRYRKQCELFPRTMFRSDFKFKSTTQPWDQDGDGLSDYAEKGLLLDPANPDTDGDGLPDGNDRNPLTAPKSQLTENQKTGQLLFYYYDRYLTRRHERPDSIMPRRAGAPDGILVAITTNKIWDGTDDPSLLAGVEMIGVNHIILPSDRTSKDYKALHGPDSTTAVEVMCLNEIKKDEMRHMMLKQANMTDNDSDRLFMVAEYTPGNMESWLVRVRKFGDIWLPVEWRGHIIT